MVPEEDHSESGLVVPESFPEDGYRGEYMNTVSVFDSR